VGADAGEVRAHLEGLLADDQGRRRMGGIARRLVEEGRGALQRTLEVIAEDLPRDTAPE